MQELIIKWFSYPLQFGKPNHHPSFSFRAATWLPLSADTLSLSNKHKHMHRHTQTCCLPRVKPYLRQSVQTGCKASIVKAGGVRPQILVRALRCMFVCGQLHRANSYLGSRLTPRSY